MSEEDVVINRREAIEAFENRKWFKPPFSLKVVKHILYSLPNAEPKRKSGRWVAEADEDGFVYDRCTACKWDSEEPLGLAKRRYNYCPNCGARMENGGSTE